MENTGKEISPGCGESAERAKIGVDAAYAALAACGVILAELGGGLPVENSTVDVRVDPPRDVLTPRQNELISETLCALAEKLYDRQSAPVTLERVRRALVTELAAVTRETTRRSALAGVRSIDG